MKANRIGTWLMIGGLLLAAAALCLTFYNLWEGKQAGVMAENALNGVLSQLQQSPAPEASQEETGPTLPPYLRDPYKEMPVVEIDGQSYVGVVEIPALKLSLPVISEWTYPRLKIAPCRYQGSAYLNDLILMAHNFPSHFGSLGKLQIGDLVYFTDMEEYVFAYTVAELETLPTADIEGMISGDWDLTLFTCTVGGENRVTVRCDRVEE